MGEVKRYRIKQANWAYMQQQSDGDYVHHDDYATLEAELATVKKVAYGNMELLDENAKLRAELGDGTTGNKYLAELYDEVWQKARDMGYGNVTMALDDLIAMREHLTKLRAELERRAVDGWKLVPVEPTPEMLDAAIQDGICVDGKPVWKKDVVFQAKWKYQQMLAAAPSAPKADDPVKVQLLEALEDLVRVNEQHNSAIQRVTGTPAGWKDDYLNLARAAIAAARKGEGE